MDMHLLMIGGDRSLRSGKKSPYYFTLQTLSSQFSRIDVLCFEVESATRFDEPLFGNVYLHPFSGNIFSLFSWIKTTVRSICRHNTVHVITCHAYPPFIHAIAAVSIAKKLHIPVLVEWHGIPKIQLHSLRETCGALLFPFSLLFLYSATAMRTVSSTVTKALKNFGIAQSRIHQVEAVYIDAETFTPELREKQYTLLFCGRIDANKRLDLCIRSLVDLPGATLAVMGDGPLRHAMQKFAQRLGVADRVTWLGYIEDPAEVARIIQSSSLLIMLSMYEGGPRVVVEALACGVPVVATNVGLVSDVIEHKKNGVLCTHKHSSVIEAICYVLEHDECAKYTQTTAANIQERYSRKRLMEQYVDVLKECM
jgi:glycosyltransferase involved in cell wall biosynthesis